MRSLAITPCEVLELDRSEVSEALRARDDSDHEERIDRLGELIDLLPADGLLGFHGQAAEWLFDDVKATWIYGAFTSTVLTAHAFCMVQLAGRMRLLQDNPGLPAEAESLEHLARLAAEAGIIDADTQAQVVQLHDRSRTYVAANLHRHELRLERHIIETEEVTDEPPLLLDARQALRTAAALVDRRP